MALNTLEVAEKASQSTLMTALDNLSSDATSPRGYLNQRCLRRSVGQLHRIIAALHHIFYTF